MILIIFFLDKKKHIHEQHTTNKKFERKSKLVIDVIGNDLISKIKPSEGI